MTNIILIFAGKERTHIFIDGTFESIPKLFCQMFTVFLTVGKIFNFMEILKQVQYTYLKLRGKNTRKKTKNQKILATWFRQ